MNLIKFPSELLINIFINIPTDETSNITTVCSKLKEIYNDDYYWKVKSNLNYPYLTDLKKIGVSWRDFYLKCYHDNKSPEVESELIETINDESQFKNKLNNYHQWLIIKPKFCLVPNIHILTNITTKLYQKGNYELVDYIIEHYHHYWYYNDLFYTIKFKDDDDIIILLKILGKYQLLNSAITETVIIDQGHLLTAKLLCYIINTYDTKSNVIEYLKENDKNQLIKLIVNKNYYKYN